MAAKSGSLSINSENIFPIIKKWLYSDHDIFYRELISNGCDAVTDLPQIQVPEELNRQVNKATGGTVDMCHLTFTGYCKDCKENQGGITA